MTKEKKGQLILIEKQYAKTVVSPNPDPSSLFIILQYYLQTKWKTTELKGTFHKVSDPGARGRWSYSKNKKFWSKTFPVQPGKITVPQKVWACSLAK